MTRLAIIGDVGGHAHRLIQALLALGADPIRGTLPEDLVVVQLGDLIHKGPASVEVLAIVDRMLAGSPMRWIQLVGNHEANYLGGPRFMSPGRELGEAHQADLRRLDGDGDLRIAVAFDSQVSPLLITHAGLSAAKWQDIGEPATAGETAKLLNAEWDDPETRAAACRWRSWPGDADRAPGVCWTSPNELTLGWAGGDTSLPFSQVSGHHPFLDPLRAEWLLPMDDLERFGVRAERLVPYGHGRLWYPNGRSLTGIDAGYFQTAPAPLSAFTVLV